MCNGIRGYCSFLLIVVFASLPHMSIGTGVVVAVAFQQVDSSPDAETGTQCDDEGLKNGDCAVEKCHKCVPPFARLASTRLWIAGPFAMKIVDRKSPSRSCMCTYSRRRAEK